MNRKRSLVFSESLPKFLVGCIIGLAMESALALNQVAWEGSVLKWKAVARAPHQRRKGASGEARKKLQKRRASACVRAESA